jgi:hypothetical protein
MFGGMLIKLDLAKIVSCIQMRNLFFGGSVMSVHYLLCVAFLLSLMGCSSLGIKTSSPAVKETVSEKPETKKAVKDRNIEIQIEMENVDLVSVQRVLNISPDKDKLGFTEKSFDTCEVGNGYSKVKNCRRIIFGLVQFRLQCRDTEGTTSEIITAANLEPMSHKDLSWSLKQFSGKAKTDSQGYAQIRYALPTSQRGQRLRVGTQSDFLYLKADEVKQVITPKYWCR